MRAAAIEVREPTGGRPLLHLHLKVVPGASKEGLAGAYGDRLKVRVAAAAESGKANAAVLALLADALGVSVRDVQLVRGSTSPWKTVAVRGVPRGEAARRLLP